MSATLQIAPVAPPDDPDGPDGFLCEQSDPAAWFPAPNDTETENAAKAICRRCPFFFPCYAGALARDEKWGIWGGTNFTSPDILADDEECDHARTEANTYVYPDGRSYCRICHRANARKRDRRKRDAELLAFEEAA